MSCEVHAHCCPGKSPVKQRPPPISPFRSKVPSKVLQFHNFNINLTHLTSLSTYVDFHGLKTARTATRSQTFRRHSRSDDDVAGFVGVPRLFSSLGSLELGSHAGHQARRRQPSTGNRNLPDLARARGFGYLLFVLLQPIQCLSLV
jgi:hypothetical protein